MMGAWRRFRTLSNRQRRDFFRALYLLPLASAVLRIRDFQNVQRSLTRYRQAEHKRATDDSYCLQEARNSARMIQAASRYGIARGNCLSRSLALCWLLHRRGIAAELHVGGKKAGDAFEAHAWVEVVGVAVNDAEDVVDHYARFDAPVTREMLEGK
ncbi:MAG TPA: lasso peptide biosynthesis B2 protein [Candidatus Acidoferrales bacterium]|nr:lasso peptide biosynthesis B2 protein [Candidatus Acidoferrales bacterium]